MKNITEVSKLHIWIVPSWFLLSIIMGYIIPIPQFLLDIVNNIFISYIFYINNYDMFCRVIFFIIFFTPIVLFLLLWNGYIRIYHSLKVKLFILICAIISISELIPDELLNNSKESRIYYIARDMMFYLDWFGGVLLNFFFLYTSIFCLTITFSKNKGF